MPNTKIFFNNQINSSVQVGDMAYVADVGFGGVTTDPVLAGLIISIAPSYIIIDKDPLVLPTIDNTKFILFAKRIEANESRLKGYYADVTFQNYSNKYVELFAISSDIALSSK